MSFVSGGFRALSVAAMVVALGTTLVACGGDDDDDASSSDTTAAATDTTAEAASGDVAKLCDINIEVATATNPVFQAEDAEGVKAAYADSGLADLFDQAEALDVPEEIAAPLQRRDRHDSHCRRDG